MKNLVTYIDEGFYQNAGVDILDNEFSTLQDLADIISVKLKDRLAKPIKISKSSVTWMEQPRGYGRDGIQIGDHFEICLKNTTSKVRVGEFHGVILFQQVYKNWKGVTDYSWITTNFGDSDRAGYRPGTNFKKWIMSRHNDFRFLRKLFNYE